MKNLFKRVIAVIICELLVLSLIPAQVFAVSVPKGIFPGIVKVKLVEPYYGEISELFPEIDMERGYDFYLSVIKSSPDYDPKVGPTGALVPYIGETFRILLKDKTVEAVFETIDILESSPLVEYAKDDTYVFPHGETIYIPGQIVVRLNQKYDGDISELFPGLNIESCRDIFSDNDDYQELKNRSFVIALADKSDKAVDNAVELLSASPLVSDVTPDSYVYFDELEVELCNAYTKYLSEKWHIYTRNPGLTRVYGEVGELLLVNMYAGDVIGIDDFCQVFFNGYLVYEYQMDDSMLLFDGERMYMIQEAIDLGLLKDEQIAQVADYLNAHRYSEEMSVGYALMTLRASVGILGKITPLMREKFDLNGDGAINVSDALFVLRNAAGIVYGD